MGAKDFDWKVKFTTTSTRPGQALVTRSGTPNPQPGAIALYLNTSAGDGLVAFFLADFSGSGPMLVSTVSYRDGIEHTALVSRRASAFTLSIDDIVVATATFAGPITPLAAGSFTGDLIIGGSEFPYAWWTGSIRDVSLTLY